MKVMTGQPHWITIRTDRGHDAARSDVAMARHHQAGWTLIFDTSDFQLLIQNFPRNEGIQKQKARSIMPCHPPTNQINEIKISWGSLRSVRIKQGSPEQCRRANNAPESGVIPQLYLQAQRAPGQSWIFAECDQRPFLVLVVLQLPHPVIRYHTSPQCTLRLVKNTRLLSAPTPGVLILTLN
jgi:hypothetical protein